MSFYSKGSKSSKNSTAWIYGRALVRSYFLTIILFFIGGAIITYTNISENWTAVFSSSILIVCTAYASVYVAIHHVRRGWLHGALVAMMYILLIMIFGSLIVPSFVLSRFVLYRILICTITGLVGGMIGVNIKEWSL